MFVLCVFFGYSVANAPPKGTAPAVAAPTRELPPAPSLPPPPPKPERPPAPVVPKPEKMTESCEQLWTTASEIGVRTLTRKRKSAYEPKPLPNPPATVQGYDFRCFRDGAILIAVISKRGESVDYERSLKPMVQAWINRLMSVGMNPRKKQLVLRVGVWRYAGKSPTGVDLFTPESWCGYYPQQDAVGCRVLWDKNAGLTLEEAWEQR